MPRPEIASPNRGTTLRGIGFAAAVVLGAVAVWLIVTSDSIKWHDVGVLCGLWGLLLGAIAVGSRRAPAAEAHAGAGEGGAVSAGASAGVGIEVRSQKTQLEHAQEVAARRAHEARIEELLRQEIRAAVNREVGTLRAEIAQLRTELLEKVGGQLRLEHIETTRLIGSDLEALQDEIRSLKSASRGAFPASTVHDLGRIQLGQPERPRQGGNGHLQSAPVAAPAAASAGNAARGGRIVEVESSIVKTAVVEPAAPPADLRRNGTSHAADAELTGPIGPAAAAPPDPYPNRHDQPAPPSSQPPSQPQSHDRPPAAPRVQGQHPAPQRPVAQQPVQMPAPQTFVAPAPVADTPGGEAAVAAVAADKPTPAVHPRAETPAQAAPAAQVAETPVQPAPLTRAAETPAQPAPAAASGPGRADDVADVFAGLPRLSRFVDDAPAPSAAPPRSTSTPPDLSSYSGRRRRSEDGTTAAPPAPTGRASTGHAPAAPAGHDRRADEHAAAGRRHRDDPAGQDLLAQLLAREKH